MINWANISPTQMIGNESVFRNLLEHSTHLGGEETVDDRVGSRVQRGQTLDECGDREICLRSWNAAKHLQQVEHNVGRPAQYEH